MEEDLEMCEANTNAVSFGEQLSYPIICTWQFSSTEKSTHSGSGSKASATKSMKKKSMMICLHSDSNGGPSDVPKN